MTIGQAADRLGVPVWRLRRLITSGKLAEPDRFGGFRVFYESQLDGLRAALVAHGCLKARAEAATSV
jgi:excisionase family DNA binding protein